ncbi:hypothetical protein M3Y98_00482800 [Aphelenchoides besseyi]|nr:hypothetical protein M3Y98_00482800 [Aphelenchoides besseyi]
MATILPIIEKIRDGCSFRTALVQHTSILHNYQCELDIFDQIVYVSAEVYPDCLDRDLDITEGSARSISINSDPGDMALQLISKRLGGPEHLLNFIPLNKKIDMTAWKENEMKIYEHLKKGGNRHALMTFAIEYDDESEYIILRPIKFYYHFALYENREIVGSVMEGVIDNPSSKEL